MLPPGSRGHRCASDASQSRKGPTSSNPSPDEGFVLPLALPSPRGLVARDGRGRPLQKYLICTPHEVCSGFLQVASLEGGPISPSAAFARIKLM